MGKGFFEKIATFLHDDGNKEEESLKEKTDALTEEEILDAENAVEQIEKETQQQHQKKVSKQEIEAKEENKPIIEAVKTVLDPELQLDVWTLGLIYNIGKKENTVQILMTFTSIMCPVGPMIVKGVEDAVKKIPGITDVKIEVVFAPLWEPDEELREMLGV